MDPISLTIGGALVAIGLVLGRVTRPKKTMAPESLVMCSCEHGYGTHENGGRCRDQVERPHYFGSGDRNGYEWGHVPMPELRRTGTAAPRLGRTRIVTRFPLALLAAALLTGCQASGALPGIGDGTHPGFNPGLTRSVAANGIPPSVRVVSASDHLTGAQRVPCATRGPLPDPECTPGSVRDDIDPRHLELTICRPGWSESILPPSREFAAGKTAAMAAYHVAPGKRPVTEYDHLVPRSLGGSNNRNNLWPEVSDRAGQGIHNSKDEVEAAAHRAVCAGKADLATAQAAFARDWTTVRAVLRLPE